MFSLAGSVVSDVLMGAAVIVFFVIVTASKSLYNGRLGEFLGRPKDVKSAVDDVQSTVNEMKGTVEETSDAVHCVQNDLDETQRLILALHKEDDDVDQEVLQERFGTELPSDVLESD